MPALPENFDPPELPSEIEVNLQLVDPRTGQIPICDEGIFMGGPADFEVGCAAADRVGVAGTDTYLAPIFEPGSNETRLLKRKNLLGVRYFHWNRFLEKPLPEGLSEAESASAIRRRRICTDLSTEMYSYKGAQVSLKELIETWVESGENLNDLSSEMNADLRSKLRTLHSEGCTKWGQGWVKQEHVLPATRRMEEVFRNSDVPEVRLPPVEIIEIPPPLLQQPSSELPSPQGAEEAKSRSVLEAMSDGVFGKCFYETYKSGMALKTVYTDLHENLRPRPASKPKNKTPVKTGTRKPASENQGNPGRSESAVKRPTVHRIPMSNGSGLYGMGEVLIPAWENKVGRQIPHLKERGLKVQHNGKAYEFTAEELRSIDITARVLQAEAWDNSPSCRGAGRRGPVEVVARVTYDRMVALVRDEQPWSVRFENAARRAHLTHPSISPLEKILGGSGQYDAVRTYLGKGLPPAFRNTLCPLQDEANFPDSIKKGLREHFTRALELSIEMHADLQTLRKNSGARLDFREKYCWKMKNSKNCSESAVEGSSGSNRMLFSHRVRMPGRVIEDVPTGIDDVSNFTKCNFRLWRELPPSRSKDASKAQKGKSATSGSQKGTK